MTPEPSRAGSRAYEGPWNDPAVRQSRRTVRGYVLRSRLRSAASILLAAVAVAAAATPAAAAGPPPSPPPAVTDQAQRPVAHATRAAAAVAPVSCAGQALSTWHYRRLGVCLAGYNRVFRTVDATGEVTGTATVEVSTDLTLQADR